MTEIESITTLGDIAPITALSDYALRLANSLEIAERIGAEKDEPEGVRFIMLSDTLVNMIVSDLRAFAAQE